MEARYNANTPMPTTGCDANEIAENMVKALRGQLKTGAGGQLSIQDAAAFLGLSVRTLQRRLTMVGLSHTRLRDRVRFEEASRLLRNPDARLIDVAYQLGFSDPAHFTRAFQGWTGIGPRCFRQRIRTDREAQVQPDCVCARG